VNTYQAIILKCFNDCNGTQQSEIDSYSLNLKDISDKIEDDRSAAIEATIIRIMKSTQRIHHNELIKRVLEQLENFKIQIQVIYLINYSRPLKRRLIILLKESLSNATMRILIFIYTLLIKFNNYFLYCECKI